MQTDDKGMTVAGVPILVTVVICAHNEEKDIKECLEGVLAQTCRPQKVIIVADRCSDRTVEISKEILPSSLIIEKTTPKWKNSYAENLEMGRKSAVGDFLAIIDADISVPPRFLEILASNEDKYASKSALVRTDPRKGRLNRLVSYWETTYLLTPLGREPRGGARVISTSALDEIGGFHDVMAPDTDIDLRFARISKKVFMDTSVIAFHLREMSVKDSIRNQKMAGQKRRELGVSFSRTLLHCVVRLRPFVLIGYLKA